MDDNQLCTRLNSSRLTFDDISQVEQFCYNFVRANDLYKLRNDAKLRAVTTSTTFEEFKDIVDAAHLQPLSRSDKTNSFTKNRLWNSIAKT